MLNVHLMFTFKGPVCSRYFDVCMYVCESVGLDMLVVNDIMMLVVLCGMLVAGPPCASNVWTPYGQSAR